MAFAYAVIGVLCALTPLAHGLEHYYGEELATWDGKTSAQLKMQIHRALNSYHLPIEDGADVLLDGCAPDAGCYSHKALGYNQARERIFGQLYLLIQKDKFALPDYYCMVVLNTNDFPRGKGPGPGKVPSTTVMNTEHAWPQSKFSNKFPKLTQKSDLHILFPVSSRSNSLRNNYPYGQVAMVTGQVCAASALGHTEADALAFLPPSDVRGDMARASFYFSTRYRMPINTEEEQTLRRWHAADPVSEMERQINGEIFMIQRTRNPFVDHPEWVDGILDF